MIVLRMALALLAALGAHLAGTALWSGFPMVFDPFLVVIVFYSLRLGPVPAQLFGMGAGFVLDGLSGSLWGMHGFAGTLIGFGVSAASQRVVVGQMGVRVLLFAAASALQQAILVALLVVLSARPEAPPFGWSVARVVLTALVGLLALTARERLQGRWSSWRRERLRRLRFR